MTAASGTDRCCSVCGVPLRDHWVDFCIEKPQPTLRDQLAEQAWGVLVAAADRELVPLHGADSWTTVAHAIAGDLLPLIEADRERAKAEALDEAAAGYATAGQKEWAVPCSHLRERAASLRATTGQPPDGGDVR